jgi:hypothetical protein
VNASPFNLTIQKHLFVRREQRIQIMFNKSELPLWLHESYDDINILHLGVPQFAFVFIQLIEIHPL